MCLCVYSDEGELIQAGFSCNFYCPNYLGPLYCKLQLYTEHIFSSIFIADYSSKRWYVNRINRFKGTQLYRRTWPVAPTPLPSRNGAAWPRRVAHTRGHCRGRSSCFPLDQFQAFAKGARMKQQTRVSPPLQSAYTHVPYFPSLSTHTQVCAHHSLCSAP